MPEDVVLSVRLEIKGLDKEENIQEATADIEVFKMGVDEDGTKLYGLRIASNPPPPNPEPMPTEGIPYNHMMGVVAAGMAASIGVPKEVARKIVPIGDMMTVKGGK